MKPPRAIFVSKKPFAIKCPACSLRFDIGDYRTGTMDEKVGQMDRDYEKHFNEKHSHEDASQAAARIVREATEDH